MTWSCTSCGAPGRVFYGDGFAKDDARCRSCYDADCLTGRVRAGAGSPCSCRAVVGPHVHPCDGELDHLTVAERKALGTWE